LLEKRKTNIFLGARAIKTGIAVTLSLFLSQYVPYSLPLLAGVAAIICIQPSITVGIQKGLIRIKATILGGLFGLMFHYIFGNNLFAIGAGVSVTLWICHHLKWEEGLSLASLIVMAVMMRISGEALPYAAGRVISTLIGIIIATLTNIVIVPPRHRITFREEMHSLTESFPNLYLKTVEAYTQNRPDLAKEVGAELKDIQTGITSLRQKLKHLQVGIQTPLGNLLEGIELEEYLLFDRGVHSLVDIVAKLEDLVIVTQRCYERSRELKKQEIISDSYYLSKEFTDLRSVLKDLAQTLGHLHVCIFNAIGEQRGVLITQICQYTDNVNKLKELSRQCLKYWGIEYIEKMDIYYFMSTYRIIFDLEEIATALTDLAQAIVGNIESDN